MGALRCNHERISSAGIARTACRTAGPQSVNEPWCRHVFACCRSDEPTSCSFVASSHETSSTRDRTATGSFGTSKSVL